MNAAKSELHQSAVDIEDFDTSADGRGESYTFLLEYPLALGLLLLFSPVILLALLAVRMTSRGPAIYTQRRVGLNGRIFTILKLRTMYLESEPDGPQWSTPGDPRVTPVGRFLRWSHLDELPQLINVLRGEMALIGPRPERPEIVAQLERSIPNYRTRLVVRPGLTGLAQVIQPPDSDLASVQRKLNYDTYYVENMSFWLDVRILLGTVLHVLNVPGDRVASLLGFPDDDLHLELGQVPA